MPSCRSTWLGSTTHAHVYQLLRDYARNREQHLSELAGALATDNLDPTPVLGEITHHTDAPDDRG